GGGVVGVRAGLLGADGGEVDQGRPGIDLGLGDGMGRRVGPVLADVELDVGADRLDGRADAGGERIPYRDAGQRLVACVCHHDLVVDDVAGIVGLVVRRA